MGSRPTSYVTQTHDMSSYEFKQLISSNDTESNSIILGSIATYEHICMLVKKQNRKGKKKWRNGRWENLRKKKSELRNRTRRKNGKEDNKKKWIEQTKREKKEKEENIKGGG